MAQNSKEKIDILGIDASNIVVGGGLTQLNYFLNYFIDTKVNKKLVIFLNSNLKLSHKDKNIKFIKIGKLLSNNYFLRLYWAKFILPKQLKKYNCDKLFCPGGLSLQKEIPSIVMFRNMQPFQLSRNTLYGLSFSTVRILFLRILLTYSFKKSKKIIFLSESSKKIISKRIKNINDYKIIHHGVNFSKFNKFKNLNFKKKISIIYVSSFDVYKNHLNLIHAINNLLKLDYKIEITFIGSIANKKYFKKILKLKRLLDPYNKFIFLKENISHNNLLKEYHKYDLGIHASSCENFPNIVLEMLSLGLPVITSSIPAMKEILGNEYIFFDEKNVKDIELKIINFLNTNFFVDILESKKSLFKEKYDLNNQLNKTFKFIFNE